MNMQYFNFICVWIATFSVATAVTESNEDEQDAQQAGDILMRQVLERLSVLESQTKGQQLPLLKDALIGQLLDRVSVLEALGKNQQQQIKELKLEVTSQKEEMTRMRRKIIEKDLHASRLNRRGLQKGINTPFNATNPRKLSRKYQENRIRRTETEVEVAFTAGLSQSILHAGEHQNIVFDHVVTNIGNAYNSHHGVFIAPVAGTYMFYTSVMSERNREIFCMIVVNGATKVTAYARGSDNRFDQGSQAVIVHLQKGDDVAVQNYLADDGIFSDGSIWTTFSGLLLYQDL